eukprot:COSAG01_NODE_7030_length_3384_cov_2.294977_1_plen_195_part_00
MSARVRGVFFGVFNDKAAVDVAIAAGEGATISITFNTAELDQYSEKLTATAKVISISEGKFLGTKGMVASSTVNLGRSVLLELGGSEVAIKLVVISVRQQILSTDYFTHFGLNMADCTCAVVKSRGHFRAGFQHFVHDGDGVLEVDVPGLSCQNLSRFSWQHLPRPVWPLDREASDLRLDWDAIEAEDGPLFVL